MVWQVAVTATLNDVVVVESGVGAKNMIIVVLCVCVRVYVCVCVRACVRVRACLRARVCANRDANNSITYTPLTIRCLVYRRRARRVENSQGAFTVTVTTGPGIILRATFFQLHDIISVLNYIMCDNGSAASGG